MRSNDSRTTTPLRSWLRDAILFREWSMSACYSGPFVMKIDLFNHFFPKRYYDRFIDAGGIQDIGKRVRNIQAIHDLDFRFKVADEFGEGYTQFLTLPAPPI